MIHIREWSFTAYLVDLIFKRTAVRMSTLRPRAASAARRRPPTTEDLTVETRHLFDTAGDDAGHLTLSDPHSEIANLEQMLSNSSDWDEQVSGMRRLMGLVNGGALENPTFRRELPRLAPGLESAATNLRSALVKQSCLTIAHLARSLGPQFDSIGDFIPVLATQLSHGTQIIAESCKFAILVIVENCVSRKILLSLVELAGKRGAAQKAVAAEAFGIVTNSWELSTLNSVWPRAETVLVKLLSDASQEVRAFARLAMKNLQRNDRAKFDRIMGHCDARVKRAVGDTDPAPEMPRKCGEPRRAPSVQPSVRTFKRPEQDDDPRRIRRDESTTVDRRTRMQEMEERIAQMERQTTLSLKRPAREPQKVHPIESLETEEKPKPVLKNYVGAKRSSSVTRSNIPMSVDRRHREFTTRVEEPRVERGRRPGSVASDRPSSRNGVSSREETPRRKLQEETPRRRPGNLQEETPRRKPTAIEPPRTQQRQRIVAPVKVEVPEPPKPKFILSSGEERSFLASVRSVIDSGELNTMTENLTNIAIGVLRCCIHSSPQICATALTVLNDLIPAFPMHFKPSLHKLVHLLIHVMETSTARASATAQLILNDLPKHYNAMELLSIAVKQKPTFPILDFIGKLVDFPDAGLTDDDLCMEVLAVIAHFQSSKIQNVCQNTAHVFMRVDEVNHMAVKQFCESLSGKERRDFEAFTREHVPESAFEPVMIDVPKFDPKAAASFRHKIAEIVKKVSDREWPEIRGQVYSEVSDSLFYDGNTKPSLIMIARILETKGVREFHKLLPGLLHQIKGEHRQHVDNILLSLLQETGIKEFVTALQSQILSADISIAQAALDLITRLIANGVDDVASILPSLFPVLQKVFLSEAPEVRKSVVLCFVEMKVASPEDVDPYLSQLSKSQQRLISVYYSRRVT